MIRSHKVNAMLKDPMSLSRPSCRISYKSKLHLMNPSLERMYSSVEVKPRDVEIHTKLSRNILLPDANRRMEAMLKVSAGQTMA